MSRQDLNAMSIENAVKWVNIPTDRNELLTLTSELIGEVRMESSRQLKLPKITGSSELLSKLDEILSEIETQFERIADAIHTSDMVHSGVLSLCKSVQNVHEFFKKLSDTNFLIFKKKGLKKQLALLSNDLRHRSTQITAALSLELLNNRAQPPVPIKEEAEDTDLDSRYRKGEKFFYGINEDRNYTLAFEHFLYAAERHHRKSMSMVADIYSYGLGLRADDAIAFRWLLKAEEMGCIVGKYKLGLFLINEIKKQKKNEDMDASLTDLNELPAERILFDGGNSQSQFSATESNEMKQEEKFLQAVDLITESAEQGHTEALTTLGQLYELADNYKVARQWYELAAAKGSLRATNLIGMLYYRGLGVPKLYETALQHFKQAARGGDPVACNNVAKCLEDGKGTERNVQKALDMYKLGADRGSSEAIYSYGYLILKETLSRQIGHKQKNDDTLLILGKVGENEEYLLEYNAKLKEGVKYLRMAVEYGVPDAAYQLARLYEQGVGVPYDISSAYSHYLWAAEIGHGKSSMCAANILYQNTISKNEVLMSSSLYKRNMVTVAQLYLQAAKSGIVMSMNAYALLLEDGTGTENGAPLVYEAAKWYLAAAEEGLLEAAGNLGFLLSTNEHILEFATIHGNFISTYDVRIWLESLIASPLIQSDQKFRDSIDKLKYAESKQGSGSEHADHKPSSKPKSVRQREGEGQSFFQPKELHSSILFGENANFSGGINLLPQRPPSLSSPSFLEQYGRDTNSNIPVSSTADQKILLSSRGKQTLHEGDGEEKKSDDVEDKKLTISGNTSSVFSLDSNRLTTTQHVSSKSQSEGQIQGHNRTQQISAAEKGVSSDNLGSEVEDLQGRFSSPTQAVKQKSVKSPKTPKSSTKHILQQPTQSHHSAKKSSKKNVTLDEDSNASRKMANLAKLKSKKSEYSVDTN